MKLFIKLHITVFSDKVCSFVKKLYILQEGILGGIQVSHLSLPEGICYVSITCY